MPGSMAPTEEAVPSSVPIELLPFVRRGFKRHSLVQMRLHACHPPSKSGIPEPVDSEALMAAMEGKPESNAKYRLAVRGHFLLLLDDAPGSRTALREMELIGLEICSKAGGEGIPPMLGLKRIQVGLEALSPVC